MTRAKSASATVDEAAVHWAVRCAYGEWTPEDHAELEAWLAVDRRHRGAYLRAQAGLLAMEDAVVQGPPVLVDIAPR